MSFIFRMPQQRLSLVSSIRWMRYFYSKINQMHHFLNFILFCSSTLHVWDGLSVHHQESKTVPTVSGMCQTDSADCLLPDAVRTVLDSWWWTERQSETCRVLLQTKISLRNWCSSLGFTIEIYHDARSYKRQMWMR